MSNAEETMKNAESTWLIVCDQRQCRIYRVGQTALGNARLQELRSMQTTRVEPEHHRPSPLVARGVQNYGSWEGDDLEDQRARARETVEWIREFVEELHPKRLKIVSARRFSDDLRREIAPMKLEVDIGEFANTPIAELSKHPFLLRWIEELSAENE